MNIITYTIRSVVASIAYAAVSFAIACVFLESNITATSAPIGDKDNEILSYLPVYNVSIFIMSRIKTAVMKVA